MKPPPHELQRVPAVVLPGATLLSLNLPVDLDSEKWLIYGRYLGVLGKGFQWWLGEWVDRAAQYDEGQQAVSVLAEQLGMAEERLMQYKIVHRRFPVSRRRAKVDWTLHWEVRYLEPPEKADELLERAEVERWNARRIRDEKTRCMKMAEAGVVGTVTFVDDKEEQLAFNTADVNTSWLQNGGLQKRRLGTEMVAADEAGRLAEERLRLLEVADEITIGQEIRDYQDFCTASERARDLAVGFEAVLKGKDPAKITSSATDLKDACLEIIEAGERMGVGLD
jgi:hypothetical protein